MGIGYFTDQGSFQALCLSSERLFCRCWLAFFCSIWAWYIMLARLRFFLLLLICYLMFCCEICVTIIFVVVFAQKMQVSIFIIRSSFVLLLPRFCFCLGAIYIVLSLGLISCVFGYFINFFTQSLHVLLICCCCVHAQKLQLPILSVGRLFCCCCFAFAFA